MLKPPRREGASPIPALGNLRWGIGVGEDSGEHFHQFYPVPFSKLSCLFVQGLKPEHDHEDLRPAVGISLRFQPTAVSPRKMVSLLGAPSGLGEPYPKLVSAALASAWLVLQFL